MSYETNIISFIQLYFGLHFMKKLKQNYEGVWRQLLFLRPANWDAEPCNEKHPQLKYIFARFWLRFGQIFWHNTLLDLLIYFLERFLTDFDQFFKKIFDIAIFWKSFWTDFLRDLTDFLDRSFERIFGIIFETLFLDLLWCL